MKRAHPVHAAHPVFPVSLRDGAMRVACRWWREIAAMVCLSLSLQAQGFRPEDMSRSFTRENGTVVESFRWGGFTVVFSRYASERLAHVCQIRNLRGKVLREIRAHRFITPSLMAGDRAEFLRDFNGDGKEELHITAWSGGAYGSYVDYLFQARAGNQVRNLLIYEGGEGRFGKADCSGPSPLDPAMEVVLQDLDGDGRPELVLADYGIHHVTGSTHGPTTVLVLAWNGSHYVDATSRFPALPLSKAQQYQRGIAFQDPKGWDASSADQAAGYLANAILAGEESQARAWLLQTGGFQAERWLADHAPTIHRCLEDIPARLKLKPQGH